MNKWMSIFMLKTLLMVFFTQRKSCENIFRSNKVKLNSLTAPWAITVNGLFISLTHMFSVDSLSISMNLWTTRPQYCSVSQRVISDWTMVWHFPATTFSADYLSWAFFCYNCLRLCYPSFSIHLMMMTQQSSCFNYIYTISIQRFFSLISSVGGAGSEFWAVIKLHEKNHGLSNCFIKKANEGETNWK